MSRAPDTTLLLNAIQAGDREAFDQLYSLAYDELRRAARYQLHRYRSGQTLNTTALVHEAYLRLVDQSRAQYGDRAHFLAIASRAMRFVLVDYVRSRTAQKRGGAAADVPLDAVEIAADESAADVLELNDALEQLCRFSPRLGQLVEYRFFGGLTFDEVAEATGLSVPTVKRDWARARAWLFEAMQAGEESPAAGVAG
jgi:RNA polymerase sigma factor (TIGR02999 family)